MARRFLIPVAFLAFISLGLPDGVLGIAWPSMRRTFTLDVGQLGIVLSMGVAGSLISSFFAGHLVRRMGVGNLLLVSNLLVVGGLLGYAAAPAWAFVILCGFVVGLGSGAIDSGINAFAADRFAPRIVTWLHASYGIGATLGPLTMTLVISSGGLWQRGYFILALALMSMSILFLSTRQLWTLAAHADASAEGAAGVAETLRRPAVWINIVLFFIYTGTEVAAGQWLYSLLTESRGISRGVAGAAVSTYWGVFTLGRVVFGFAAGRLSRRTIIRIGMLGAPGAAVLIWMAHSPPLAFLGAALLGFFLAPIYPMLISATPERLGRRHAAHAVGFQVCAATVGVAAIPSLAGLLAGRMSLEIIGPFLLACTVAVLWTHELALCVRGGVRVAAEVRL